MMELNINDKERVKLTKFGHTALKQQYDEFWGSIGHPAPPPYTPPTEDADGWSEWQLWNLMEELGRYCRMGVNPPFQTTIELIGRKTCQPMSEDQMTDILSMRL